MELTPKLAQRFEKLQTSYPVKRSALVPMLMYAQDEYGSVSDEMIAEIAKRLDLRTVQVEETLAYYSMLHRKPMGKNHVQICTNAQRNGWKSDTKKLRKMACFPSKRSSASERAQARRRCR
jgi:NADH:ubiquinone oxidoreductase subunit E